MFPECSFIIFFNNTSYIRYHKYNKIISHTHSCAQQLYVVHGTVSALCQHLKNLWLVEIFGISDKGLSTCTRHGVSFILSIPILLNSIWSIPNVSIPIPFFTYYLFYMSGYSQVPSWNTYSE